MKSFIVDIPVAPLSQNQIYRRGKGEGLYMTNEGKAFKKSIWAFTRMRAAAMQFAPTPLDLVGVRLTLRFPDGRGDIDGPVKPILDALQGAAYENDRQVEELVVRRRLRDPNPGLTIEVRIL